MINLLPPDDLKELRAARSNRLLMRYLILSLVAIVLVAGELFGAYTLIANTKARSEEVIAENEQKSAEYASVKVEAENFRKNLSTANSILSKQVPYTSIMTRVANLLPSGVVMDQLVIDPATFGQPTTIAIRAKSNAAAIDLKTKLQDSGIFDQVNFITISSTPDNNSSYPYTATLSVIFKPGSNK